VDCVLVDGSFGAHVFSAHPHVPICGVPRPPQKSTAGLILESRDPHVWSQWTAAFPEPMVRIAASTLAGSIPS
jgi:hypothetical protein